MINFFPKNIKECDDTINKLIRENRKLQNEIARLNKIIDEFEKWLWNEIESHNFSLIKLKSLNYGNTIRVVSITRLMESLDKLQELKEGGKK